MKFLLFVALFVLVICAFFAGAIFSLNPNLPKNFFDMRLIEISQLIFPLVVALLIGFYVNAKVDLGVKRREALGHLLDRAQDKLEELFGHTQEYMGTPSPELGSKVVFGFKQLSVFAQLIEQGIEEQSKFKCSKQIVSVLLRFKKAATDSPFLTQTPQFSPWQTQRVLAEYGKLCALIHTYKMKIYT
jgi:hypothetical protein